MALAPKCLSVLYLLVVSLHSYLQASESNEQVNSINAVTMFFIILSAILFVLLLFIVIKRMQAERNIDELISSEERLRLSMEGTNDGLWDYNLETNAVFYSDGYRKMLGYSTNEFPNNIEVFNDHVHPDDKEGAWSSIATHLESKIPVDIDFRMRNKKGEYRIMQVRAQAVWEGDKATRMVGSIRDITERVELETQLRQSQKMESIGQLTGGIAHDFNNVLSGIIGATDILLLKHKDPEDQELLELISNTASRAADLTNRLLAYSRSSDVNARHMSFHSCIHEALDILRSTIQKRISIAEELNAQKDGVKGDMALLVNVIVNIALNARDSIEKSGTITISTDNTMLGDAFCQNQQFNLEPGEYLHVRIQDTGKGIEEELIERIFEPFFTTKQVGEGTGLGLSGVFGTMRDHAGAVTVESTPGEGSCFHLYLPISETDTSTHQDTSTINQAIGTGTILIVDDEPIILQTTERLLKINKHQTFCADDGTTALEVLAEHPEIDVVLLDMIMPKMTGEECFAKIKEINPDLPIIIISGFTNEASIDELKAKGLFGFIKKPFNINDLLMLINKALNKKQKN